MDENKVFYIYVEGGFGFWGECSGFSGPYTMDEATKHSENIAAKGYTVKMLKAIAKFSRERPSVSRTDL